MSGKGSPLSRAKRSIINTRERIHNFGTNPTTSRKQKAKQVGKEIKNTYIDALYTVLDTHKPLHRRIGAYVGVGLGITTIGIPAVGVLAATSSLGGITRVIAPVAGTAVGTGIGVIKGFAEAPIRIPYGIGKAIYHSPTAVVRSIKKKLAMQRYRKRTGTSNRTLSNVEHLETKQSKAQSALQELEARQEAKLEKKAQTLSITALDKKQKKYQKQRNKLQDKINKRISNLKTAVTKKLNKTRTSKAKRGGIQKFTLGDTNNARKNGENNTKYGKRIGLVKLKTETDIGYTQRLQNYTTSVDYLKKKVQDKYSEHKTAYNKAITEDITTKLGNLNKKLTVATQTITKSITLKKTAEQVIKQYTISPKKKDIIYFKAISNRAKADRDIKAYEQLTDIINKKKYTAESEKQRILNTKGLNAKKQRMDKRRARLEESKQNITDAGYHIISPATSIFYGAKTGLQIGNKIGKQALKYGTFGLVEKGTGSNNSNQSREINKSAGKLWSYKGSTKKKNQKNNTTQKTITNHETATAKLNEQQINTKTTIKSMEQHNLLKLKKNINKEQTNITQKITDLKTLRNNSGVSISQKIRIDELIDKLRSKYMKYAEALLSVNKKTLDLK